MIVSTNKSDTMLKRAFEKGKTSVMSIDRMIEQFSLDPTITDPVRECYIVTNEDISASKTKAQFEQSAACKHPNVKIIFINKSSRPIYQQGLPGIDAILQKPKPGDIQQAVSAVIASGVVGDAIEGYGSVNSNVIPDYQPAPLPTSSGVNVGVFDESMLGTDEPEVPSEPAQPETLDVPEPEPVRQDIPDEGVVRDSALASRIQQAGKVADISVVMREVEASELIKDLIESNSTYAGIEEKLKSINDTIFSILSDTRIKSLDEKLSKVHAILHDKAFFSAKGNTLIEQRLEEVIDMICLHTSSLLQSRLSEIETAIRKIETQKDFDINHARLSGLNEERANIIIELRTLEAEIGDIFKAADRLTIGTATYIAEGSDNITGNEMINMHLKARGAQVVSDDTVLAVRAALELASDKIPTSFKEMKLKILSMIRLMSKMFDLDSEIIAAQQAQINFLKAHNVEDSIVADTLLKKSLRVYVGEEGTGRSIVTYLLSRYKSRQNANVLCLDLTGSGKYSYYGIQCKSLDTYMVEQNQQEFMLVSGSIENSVAAAQRIVSTLLRAADYYRVINVVLTPEQRELFSTISQDVLSVNFIVDTNVERIERMRKTIEECTVENVGRRVIVNRCDIPVRAVVSRLGLDDSMDYQICVIPTVPAISDASLNNFNPYGVSSVDLIMEDVVKHA